MLSKGIKFRFQRHERIVLLISCTVCFAAPTTYAQSSEGSVYRPAASIREQLEGRVENSYKPSDSGANLSGQLDKYGALRGGTNDSGGRFHGRLNSDNLSRLQGKVEERDLLGHLYRPYAGDPLGKSVKVLSGANYAAALQGKTEDVSLDSVLNAGNFNLPLQRMTPKSDYNALSSTQADLRSGRGRTQPSYTWGIGGWGVGEWAVDGWGIDDWPRYDYYAYRFPNRLQADMGWDNMSFNQQRVRADLLDPNFLNRPMRTYSKIPTIAPFSTNTGWGISPMNSGQPSYADQNILWDAWYRKVSDAMYRNWVNRGQDPGLATLRITVRRNRTLEAQILRCNNPRATFRKNLMDAVVSLNGSPVLDFPSMSQRQSVSFNSEFNASSDTARGAFSERSGEIETIRQRRNAN